MRVNRSTRTNTRLTPHPAISPEGERVTTSRSHSGFTIVELMVVIAVISLLIGLLVPAVASVAANSRSTRCQLNLKQMAIAAQQYATVFDCYPVAIRFERINNITHTIAWDWVTAGTSIIEPGPLWKFSDHPGEVMQCPDYHGKPNYSEEFTGYNYNTGYIGGETKPFGALGWKFVKPGIPPHACDRAAKCAMFGDAGRRDQTNKYMRGPLPTLTGDLGTCYSGAQAFRHGDCTNVSYVDGHVATVNQSFKGQYASDSLLSMMGWPKNGFLADDESSYDPR